MTFDLAEITDLDARDPLRDFRDEFQLREGLIYVDGNSLGAAPKATAARLADGIACSSTTSSRRAIQSPRNGRCQSCCSTRR